MAGIGLRATLLAMLLGGGLALWGCGSDGFWRTEQGRREAADLRAERDREVAQMEGKPVEPRVTPSAAGAKAAPVGKVRAELPAESKESRPRPEWVATHRSSGFPLSRYITGVGSCRKSAGGEHEAPAVAAERARDAVARNIRVRIRSEYTSAAKLVTEMRTGKTEVKTDTTALAEEISSTADLMLEGVQIVDRWYDEKDGTCWALAAMDRRVAGENILDRMKQLRREMVKERELGGMFRAKGRRVKAVAHYSRARKASLARLAYRSQLRVVAPDLARGLPAAVGDDDLIGLWHEAALARDALHTGVVVFVEGDGGSVVSSRRGASFSTMLRGLELNTVKLPPPPAASYAALRRLDIGRLREWVGGGADCVLLANLGAQFVQDAKLGTMTVYFYRGKGEAVVLDLSDGGVIAEAGFAYSPTTHTGKADRARAKEGALSKAATQLRKMIERDLAKALSAAE